MAKQTLVIYGGKGYKSSELLAREVRDGIQNIL